jgi:hypothetical protein
VGLLEVLRANTALRASDEPHDETPEPGPSVALAAADPLTSVLEQGSSSLDVPEESLWPAASNSSIEPAQDSASQDVIESLTLSPASQPEAGATVADTPTKQPDVSEFLEALATAPDEPSKPDEALHFPWMDDVLERIDLEAVKDAKGTDARDERPQFLDLLGDLSQPEVVHDSPPLTVGAPLPSETRELLETNANPEPIRFLAKPSARRPRIWMATAAVLAFVALAAVQWRSQITRTSKRLEERITDKINDLFDREQAANANNSSSVTSADPVDPNQSHTAPIQTERPLKPQPDEAASSGPGNVPVPTGTAVSVQPLPATQNQQEAAKEIAPGEQEMMKAKEARTAASRSEWLWKATAKGNPEAPVQLAELYIAGDGVPQSCEQAMVLLKMAARNNNALACNHLASLYSAGTCVPRSELEAYRWFNSALAADPNNQSAKQNRELVWEQMSPEERTLAQESR